MVNKKEVIIMLDRIIAFAPVIIIVALVVGIVASGYKKAPPDTAFIVSGLRRRTVIGKAAVITGDLTAKGPITVTGMVQGNIACEDKVCIRGEVVGNIAGKSILVMTGGRIRGNITSVTDLVLQVDASIEGDLVAAQMSLDGNLTGNINCSGDLCLGAKSVVTGDISTKDISTTLGAQINGRVEMKKRG